MVSLRKNVNKFIGLLLFGLILYGCSAENTDILLEKHLLIGQEIALPDYTLVVSRINSSFSLSPKTHIIDAALVSLDSRLSTVAFPSEGMVVSRVLDPGSKLVVDKVYNSRPSMLRSIFAGATTFAVLADKSGRQYTAPVWQDEIAFEINGCSSRECKRWRQLLHYMDEKKRQELKIEIEYFLKDQNGRIIWDNSLRPPYPAEMLNISKKNLIKFISDREISLLKENEDHPYISVVVDRVGIGNLLLDHEKLGIKNIGILME